MLKQIKIRESSRQPLRVVFLIVESRVQGVFLVKICLMGSGEPLIYTIFASII